MSDPAKPQTEPEAPNQLNAPKVDPATGQPTQRAITTPKQAHGIAKSIIDRAVERLRVAAAVAKAYNAEPPFEGKLARTAQGWRNDFSTNFLGSIIDRVKPQLTDPLNAGELLVFAALPPAAENGAEKARIFNEETTRRIRGWPEWRDFLARLAQDVALFGNAAPARVDADWRPRLWRYDEIYFAELTGQHASKVPVAVFKQKMMLHDFLQLIRDPKIADAAGYNVPGCIKAADGATGNANQSPDVTALERQDALREQGAMGYSYAAENTTRTVNLYHILVRDYSGEVDLWTVTQHDGTEIRNVQGAHKAMEECMTLFTMQTGNGRYYGSKGLGRLLTNLHIAIERGRCYDADKRILAGLTIWQADAANIANQQAKVRFPWMVLPEGAKVVDAQITYDHEAAQGMDDRLVGVAESIAGAFIPPQIDSTGSSKTKIEAAQKAEREQAVRHGVLARFLDHAADLLNMMKGAIYAPINLREGKRAFEAKQKKQQSGLRVLARKVWALLAAAFGADKELTPDIDTAVADEEAVGAVVNLLEAGLSIEEIAALAVTPSGRNNEEEGANRDAKTLDFIAANAANQFINQRSATETAAKILVGEERAKQLIIPEEDPNIKAIAQRQQTIEFSEMLDGNPMPVASTDNHGLHRAALAPPLRALVESLTQSSTAETIGAAELGVQHYADHLAQDRQARPELAKQEADVMQDFAGRIEAAKRLLAQAAPPQPQQTPLTAEGAPEEADVNQQLEPLKMTADVALRKKEAEQRDRDQALEEAKFAHSSQAEALKLQQDNVRIYADAEKAKQQAEIAQTKAAQPPRAAAK